MPLDVSRVQRLDTEMADLKQQGLVQAGSPGKTHAERFAQQAAGKRLPIFHFIGHGIYDAGTQKGDPDERPLWRSDT
jgi:hypothetical protein